MNLFEEVILIIITEEGWSNHPAWLFGHVIIQIVLIVGGSTMISYLGSR